MTRSMILLASLCLGACGHRLIAPPSLAFDPAKFEPAQLAPDPAVKNAAAPAPPILPVLPSAPPLPPPPRSEPASPKARVMRANAAAIREPTTAGYMNAMQVYPWAEGALYRLYAAPEHVTDIALQPGEVLQAVSAGDTVRWTIGDTTSGAGTSRRVHVLVKPFAAGLSTNMLIATDRRLYHLTLQSTTASAMAAIAWTYPDDQLVMTGMPSAGAVDNPVAAPDSVNVEQLRFRYVIKGDSPAWKPTQVFDDGHKVYIEFPARLDQGEAPPLFVVGPRGDHQLVNYRVRGNRYVVDRLFAAAELRMGEAPQQVVRITRADARENRR